MVILMSKLVLLMKLQMGGLLAKQLLLVQGKLGQEEILNQHKAPKTIVTLSLSFQTFLATYGDTATFCDANAVGGMDVCCAAGTCTCDDLDQTMTPTSVAGGAPVSFLIEWGATANPVITTK